MVLPVQIFLLVLGIAGQSTDPAANWAGDVLTLDAALDLALEADDPSVQQFEEQARALEDMAVAESQLPDPQVGVAMVNLPTSVDFNQENMTQLQGKLRQAIPAGKTLELRGERRRAESRGARHAASLQRLQIVLDTRLAWLEMFYWLAARDKIVESRAAVVELEAATRADYAAGRGTSQTLMRTRLEISLLDDRLIEAERLLGIGRADLARYIGAAARRALPEILPVLAYPGDLAALREGLVHHPAIEQAESAVDARAREIGIAEQQYKPDWAVEGAYGVRSGNRMVGGRDDFLTFGLTFDLPIFTGKRQDRSLSAAKHARQAAMLAKESRLLEFGRQLDREYVAWTRLAERIDLYEQAVIARAGETTDASRSSWQSGFTDFPELIRARLAELDAELELVRLRVDRARAQARLLFLEGADR